MRFIQRILGFIIFIIFVSGLALGGEPDAAVVARKAGPGVRPFAQAVPLVAPHQPFHVVQSLTNFPMRFEANQGQTDKRVEFLSRGQGYTLFLTGDEAVLSLKSRQSAVGSPQSAVKGNWKLETGKSAIENRQSNIGHFRTPNPESPAPGVLRMKLVGARAVRAEGIDLLPSKSNYFLGSDPKRWRMGVPTYGRVKYENVYPGIDLVYYGKESGGEGGSNAIGRAELEFDFVVAPGADPRAIRFALTPSPSPKGGGWPGGPGEGSPVRIDARGDLVVNAGEGAETRFHKPVVYQEEGGQRHAVEGRYVLLAENRVRFEVGAYDGTKPLVIDPVLSYSTFLGGANADSGRGVAADSSGNIYVAGTTVSVNFPTKIPFQTDSNGNDEVFVTKVDPTGAALVYSTYLGGSGSDRVSGMALAASGTVTIAGTTTSANFPTTSTALQTSLSGGTCGTSLCSDAFVARIKADGTGLDYSTYLGGTGADGASGIALDGTGNAYIAGWTVSTNFPTVSPLQAALAGATDAFLAKVKPDGTGLLYSTFLGGGASDVAESVAVDADGNAIVTGHTLSTDFPTANALQGTNQGLSDAFVTKISAAGDARVYSTYLGGTGADRARAIAVDAAGNAYVGGETLSVDFPVSANPFQAAWAAGTCGALPCADAFLAKLDPAGATALYSTYLGGTGFDQILGVTVNAAEEAFVTGGTTSADLPLQNPLQAVIGGGTCASGPCSDTFVTRVDATGSLLIYSTFLGGSGSDSGQAIFVDGSDNAFVTGVAASSNFPTTHGAFQATAGAASASGDAFVVRIGPSDASSLIIAPGKLTFADQPKDFTSDALPLTLTNQGTGLVAFTSVTVTGDFAQTNTCEPTLAVGSNTCTISVTFTPLTVADLTGELTITSDAPGSPHKVVLAGKGIEAKSHLTFNPATVEFPDEDVGATSAPITVTVSNTGFADITITAFTVAGNFAQTNNCPVSPNKLLIGGSCTADLTFKPEGSGVRSGTFSITSDAGNAGGGLNSVTISGKGIGVFTLSAPTSSVIVKRGTKTTTFTLNAEGPSDFTGAVALTCQDSPAACAFSPASIKVGESSTLTLSNLDLINPAEFTFTVRGTNELQFAETSYTVTYSDYSMAPKPTFGSVSSGDTFVVRMTLSSKNGFDGSATFSCAALPQESSCSFSPTTVALDGTNPVTVDVTIHTTTRVTTWAPPRPPSTQGPRLIGGLAILALLYVFAVRRRRMRLVLASAILLALMMFASCNDYYYYTYTGTLPGTFPVQITATVGTVSHSATFFLTVL